MIRDLNHIMVLGGAGYVGSKLVPILLAQGYQVTVFDLFIYGDPFPKGLRDSKGLRLVKGDLRNIRLFRDSIRGIDAIIHLACISNDPSFDLNPTLAKSINYDGFLPVVNECVDAGVKRFIFASSSSVYGVKTEDIVHEGLSLDPLTDYSKYKAQCEDLLLRNCGQMVTTIVRPATLCGISPRQRLDLTVNILTTQAVLNHEITVHGGDQVRPNLHIDDMLRFYCRALEWNSSLIDREIFNIGEENHSIKAIAELVRFQLGHDVNILYEKNSDQRSYRISSKKAHMQLGFHPKLSIVHAIDDLAASIKSEALFEPLSNPLYYNIKRMMQLGLE
jgi:nucleoside-diphosphate-sugar epimerase